MRRALTPLALFVFAVSATAADKVEPKQTYWQTLPGVGYVSFDPDRNPVFHLEGGFLFAKTGQVVKRPEHATGSAYYFDRSSRLWVLDYHNDRAHYGGTGEWERIDRRPVKLFDAADGRVFLFDGTGVHVLGADGKWTAQAVCDKPHREDVFFAESGKRVWLWGSREKPGGREGMLGVWSCAGGKWTHHTAKTGLPFDSVRWLHPLADGTFVVIEDRTGDEPRSRLRMWHPDRALTDKERAMWEGTQIGAPDLRTGTDGTLYLPALRRNEGLTAVSAKGVVSHIMARDWYDGAHPQTRWNGRHVVFGTLGEKPPALPSGDGEFVGADRDGRYYFVRGNDGPYFYKNAVVTVVWPTHEKPGDILRAGREKIALERVVKDDAGKIWAEPGYGGLFQWHAGKWLETPVAPLYHPAWTARNMSPWNEWTWNAGHLFRLHGKGGSVLAVRVRDVYQQDEPPNPDGAPVRPIRDPNFPHPAPAPGVPAAGERPKYWLEAFLFHGGKWVGPLDVKKLLADHAATLLADFPTASGEACFFALANDGARLWAAFDGKVLTAAKDGKVTEAEWPRDRPKRPLPFIALGTFADKKVVLAGDAGGAHELKLADGKVAAVKFELPTGVVRNPVSVSRWRLAADGTFWLWTAEPYGQRAQVWHFRDGKWAEQKGVGSPLYEDASGVVCLAEPRWAYRHHVMIVKGVESKELLFPRDEWQFGFTDVPKDVPLWAVGDALLFVDTSGAKPVVRWRLLQSGFVPGYSGPAAVDAKGTVLVGAFRGVLGK